MNTTEEISTKDPPESERLCKPCIDYGVARLLDHLRENVRHSRFSGSEVHIVFREDSGTGPGHSMNIGIESERSTYVGIATSIQDREACPVCDFITHVLPSEFQDDLSGSKITLHLPNSERSGHLSIAAASSYSRNQTRIRGCSKVHKLYITIRIGGMNFTSGCIHLFPPRPAKTIAESSVNDPRGIIKHEICLQPEI